MYLANNARLYHILSRVWSPGTRRLKYGTTRVLFASVCRFAAGVKVIELSGKCFSDRAFFVVVKNVRTHV